MVGVPAPAGYGKSTLLAEWARAEDRRLAWVSLDRYDDPSAMLTLLAAAYARDSPGNEDLVADMRGLGVSALGRASPHLASVLNASPAPFVLMLDDLHELRSPDCHDVLGVVISGIPRGSGGGCSSAGTPSARRSPSSTESSASPHAPRRWSGRR